MLHTNSFYKPINFLLFFNKRLTYKKFMIRVIANLNFYKRINKLSISFPLIPKRIPITNTKILINLWDFVDCITIVVMIEIQIHCLRNDMITSFYNIDVRIKYN